MKIWNNILYTQWLTEEGEHVRRDGGALLVPGQLVVPPFGDDADGDPEVGPERVDKDGST